MLLLGWLFLGCLLNAPVLIAWRKLMVWIRSLLEQVTEPSHIWMQGRRCSVTSSEVGLNRMALSMHEVTMNQPVPVRLSALLTLAALLPITATPLLAYEYRGDHGRRYDGRDDYGYRAYDSRRAYNNSRNDDNRREYLYRPNGVARRAAWEEPNADTNSCVEGSVIGGLLGAGLGAALSRGNGRWFGVPVGGAAGALIGCQVDGG